MGKMVLFLVKIAVLFVAGMAIAQTVNRVRQPGPAAPRRIEHPGGGL